MTNGTLARSDGSDPPYCELLLWGDSPHIRQTVTGFCELAAAGRLKLKICLVDHHRTSEWLDPLSLRAVIDGHRVIYDLSDGWYVPLEVRPYLDRAEHYFKRSLDHRRLEVVPADVKVWPLGLNYLVSSPRNLSHQGLRPFDARRLARNAARQASIIGRHLRLRDIREMSIGDFETPPAETGRHILFMCRAWPPSSGDETDYLRTDREAVNEMRAAYIRTARAEFGERFIGGFARDDFARREYGDCLLPDARASERRAFLGLVRQARVCVATTGLHGSIGWKMAEYVAASRAIVSEPLRYRVPGGFAAGRNFLEFDGPEGFIVAVERLMGDDALNAAMRHANWDYYRQWVRPDAQVLRSLERILGDLRDAPEREARTLADVTGPVPDAR